MTRRHRARHGHEGLSMVELLVVMAILAILAGLTVPAMLTFMPSDDLEADTRELFTTLKFAQVHAVSQRVETAVVYALDNYLAPDYDPDNDDPLREPIIDSVTGGLTRVVTAFAVVERIKDEALANYVRTVTASTAGALYAQIDNERGNFTEFDYSVGLLLSDPRVNGTIYYSDDRPRYVPQNPGSSEPNVGGLGMASVSVVFGLDEAEAALQDGVAAADFSGGVWVVPFPGHVFKATGGMEAPLSQIERFDLTLAPRPNQDPEVRLVEHDTYFNGDIEQQILPRTQDALVHNGLQLFKSTGRVRIMDE